MHGLYKNLDEGEIIRLYRENKSALSISKLMKVDVGTITNRLKKNNIEILRHRMYLINENYFEIINKENAYWLGFIMADGYNSGKFIRVDIQDQWHLEKLRDSIFLNKDMPVRTKLNSQGRVVYYLTMQHPKITKRCESLGIVKAKSHITKYPNIDSKFDSHFIRGLFDGDGSLSKSKNGNYFKYTFSIVGSYDLMRSVFDKLNLIGINAKFAKCKMIYRVYVCGNQQILRLLDWVYSDTDLYLDRKYNRYLELSDYCKTRRKKKIIL